MRSLVTLSVNRSGQRLKLSLSVAAYPNGNGFTNGFSAMTAEHPRDGSGLPAKLRIGETWECMFPQHGDGFLSVDYFYGDKLSHECFLCCLGNQR
jgi:hypothetical protein